jgi:uncharacterized protein (DUF305 family)
MELSTKSIAAISGLSALAVGAIAIPLIFLSPIANPLQQPGRSGWHMPMHQGAGRGHHQHMMQMMQASNEFEFLSLMIPHHEEAIATAQRVLEYSDRPEMRAFAQDIIEVQTAEIEQMEVWLDVWYPGQETSQTYSPMMRDLSRFEGNDLDQAFLEDMIMHHMGAVMMSQRLVNHGLVEHSEVQPFAQNIAHTQRQEIWQMQAWLQDWYGISGMPGPMHRGRR